MKKRSMMAIASLAAGFVVAAISPTHTGDHHVLGNHPVLGDVSVDDTVGTVTDTVGDGSLSDANKALG
ncbi:hypothetical protein ACFV29_14535 [Streptomyces sp. NPDC059690]|uniref:hypothetical protein n=1 Tax=Streptomyces sp. NPDC059690 TaxID=3346907 RepID=UPI00368A52C8